MLPVCLSVCLAVPPDSQIISQPVQICLGMGKCLTAVFSSRNPCPRVSDWLPCNPSPCFSLKGTSTKYSPQRVGLTHMMEHEDVIQIVKK